MHRIQRGLGALSSMGAITQQSLQKYFAQFEQCEHYRETR